MFNEEAVLPLLVSRLRAVLDALAGTTYEVIVVDDASTDATREVLAEVRATWPQLRTLRLLANRGHQTALTAGLDACQGEWVVTMDGDLQDPPEIIPALLERARRGDVDVVYAQRADRSSDAVGKRTSARAYYRVTRLLTGVSLPTDVGDFRLISRRVVDALARLPERQRVYRLLIPWLGFESALVPYARAARPAGRSKYSLARMTGLATDSLVGFTSAPLRVATWLGLLSAALSLLLAAGAVVVKLLGGETVPGWASITVGVLFLGAVQLVCLGVLGEYVGRIYSQVQGRPLYLVEEAEPVTRPTRRA